MQVTELDIVARLAGGNGQPTFGYAKFDDGKYYGFNAVVAKGADGVYRLNGRYDFFSYRSTHQGAGRSMFSFESAKRERALICALGR